jgi:hypothetical protein
VKKSTNPIDRYNADLKARYGLRLATPLTVVNAYAFLNNRRYDLEATLRTFQAQAEKCDIQPDAMAAATLAISGLQLALDALNHGRLKIIQEWGI